MVWLPPLTLFSFLFDPAAQMCRRQFVETGDRTVEVEGPRTTYRSLEQGFEYGDNNVITSQYTCVYASLLPRSFLAPVVAVKCTLSL